MKTSCYVNINLVSSICKSIHVALIVLLDNISEAFDREECVIGVFLDFDHSILRKKNPQKYGIQGLALRWFEDYLHD